MTILKRQLH